MAAVAFDSLRYATQLEAAGMPRAQAEVVAKGLTTMFIHNFDSLVTRDYLDTRFAEMEAVIDKRFADNRLELHGEFANIHGNVAELRGTLKLHSWMLALLIAGIFLPLLESFVS